MLSILRRLTGSKIGVFVTLAALVVIALAFAAGDITQYSSGAGSSAQSDTVATVGKVKVGTDELKTDTQNEMNAYRQQNPELTMAQYIQGGGFDATLQRMINSLALEQFGRDQGMAVSKRSIDGQIAGIPAFQGVNGKFDPALYKQFLAQQRGKAQAGLHLGLEPDGRGGVGQGGHDGHVHCAPLALCAVPPRGNERLRRLGALMPPPAMPGHPRA